MLDALPQHWQLLPMTEADIAGVRKIETAVYEFPWSEGIFRDCLQSHYLCYLLQNEAGIPIAYMIASVAVEECHVLNICVDPECRGRGLGRLLLRHLLDMAVAKGARQVFLEVRISNQVAINLYQQSGFQEIGRRKNYYPAMPEREDALVMALTL